MIIMMRDFVNIYFTTTKYNATFLYQYYILRFYDAMFFKHIEIL